MLKRFSLCGFLAFATTGAALAQSTGSVGIGTNSPQASAALDVQSTTKGLLPPRLTRQQRDNMPGPLAAGLLIYQTDDTPGVYQYTGTNWVRLGDNLGNHEAQQTLALNSNNLFLRRSNDSNHGLSWFGSGKPWNGRVIDGVVLFGLNGGALGVSNNNVRSEVLTWNNDGNVGIGITNPTARLEVAGQVKITGGNPAAGRVLTSDADGLASWQSAGAADNLGNHTATQNLQLNGNALNNNGVGGLRFDNSGNASFGAAVKLTGVNALELGVDVVGKEPNAGTISYQRFSDGLDIVGAGVPGNRKVSLYSEGGAQVFGPVVIGGTTRVQQLQLLATPDDPLATVTSRPVPQNQGGTTERSELILFNGNDGNTGFGPDLITLRAPAIRLQTYNNPLVTNIDNDAGANTRLYITPTGLVGIGTNSPVAPLDVQTVGSLGSNYTFAFYALNTATNQVFTDVTNDNPGNVSIRAAGRVVANEFNATSDARLKRIIGLSNGRQDLALLQRLRITDYHMRDKAEFGDRRFKKVIAQEVEEVFPQAVQRQSGFLPDIYAVAKAQAAAGDSLLRLTLPAPAPAGTVVGQRIKLVGAAGPVVGVVARVNGREVQVRGAGALRGQQEVFAFGLEHRDVRAVDYEALAMLNVSATQELARRLADLEAQNASQQAQLQAMKADHAALESVQEQLRRLQEAITPPIQARR